MHKFKKNQNGTSVISTDEKYIISFLKSVIISICISLVGVLIFAFFIKIFSISDSAIKPVNQVIKAISIFIGCCLGLKKQKNMGLLKGLFVGIFYVFLAFLIFSILSGEFSFGITLLIDVCFGGVMGAVCGVVAINFFAKK